MSISTYAPPSSQRWEGFKLQPNISVPSLNPNDPYYIVQPSQTFQGLNFDAVANVRVDMGWGSFGTGSGVLLPGGKHVLTAAHVVEEGSAGNTNVYFDLESGRQEISVKNIHLHPGWVGSPDSYPWEQLPGFDIAVLELESVAPTSGIGFYRGSAEIGNDFVVSGYGVEGTGVSGDNQDDALVGEVKRWGMNTFDTSDIGLSGYYNFQNISPDSVLFYDFDNGNPQMDTLGSMLNQSHLGLGLNEVMTTSGDSGGPGFIQTASGEWQVAGLVQAGNGGGFGSLGVMARASHYESWIDSIVGVPTKSNDVFTGFSSLTSQAKDLVAHLSGDISGINILNGSSKYIGADAAVSTFESFDFGDGIRMDNPGVLLTTGDGVPALYNSSPNFSVAHGTPGDSHLDKLAMQAFDGAGATEDAAILEFSFVAQDPAVKAVRFELIFGSEEYPEFVDSSYVDIAALTVNGKNYALFDGDPEKPLSVIGNNVDSGSLLNNMSGFGGQNSTYGIEYNGISPSMVVNIPLSSSIVYNVRLAIADTGDQVWDSGLFISNFTTSKVGAEGLQVKVVASEQGGTLAPAGPNTATYFEGGGGNDIMLGSTAADVYDLTAGGSNTIEGSASQLNNDTVLGFTQNDTITVQGSFFSLSDVAVTQGSAILDIDTNGDGIADTNLRLEGDYDINAFSVQQTDQGSVISYNGETDSFEVDVSAFVAGVLDQLEVSISPILIPVVNALIERAFDDQGNIAGATFLKLPQVRDAMVDTFGNGETFSGPGLVNAIHTLNDITENVLLGLQEDTNLLAGAQVA